MYNCFALALGKLEFDKSTLIGLALATVCLAFSKVSADNGWVNPKPISKVVVAIVFKFI